MAARGGKNDSRGMDLRNATVTVFLADDSVAIRQRVNGLLRDAAFTIVGEAGSPQGCISGILEVHPDVVVLDHQLEGGTGLQVMRAVRKADPFVAFVVFSNNSAPAYRKRYLGQGAARFLDKSTEFDQLAVAVAAAGAQAVH
jgi:two-component system response regulator DesR